MRPRTLSESASKDLLRAAGVPIADELVVSTPDDAVARRRPSATRSSPSCAATASPTRPSAGWCASRLGDAEDGRRRGGGPARRRRRTTTAPSGSSSHRWSAGSRELIAGVVRDEQFGPTVMLGVGGVLAEAIADVVFRPAPIDARVAGDMIDQLRAHRVARRVPRRGRGRPPGTGRHAGRSRAAGRRTFRHRQRRRQPADRRQRRTPARRRRTRRAGRLEGDSSARSAPQRGRPSDEYFRALFEPRGVAVAGASTHPGKFGFVSLHNLLVSGYEGAVYATNLKGETVLGIETVRGSRRPARWRGRPGLRVHAGGDQPRRARASARRRASKRRS